jgi:hypothetical protein
MKKNIQTAEYTETCRYYKRCNGNQKKKGKKEQKKYLKQ